MKWRWMWWPSDVCVLNKFVSWIDAHRGRCVNLKVWLFSGSDGGQDAPAHLSSNANNCWRVSYGTQVLEGPTRTKLYIGICHTLWKSTWHKNVISCMLPYILIHACETTKHKAFMSCFTHVPWFAYWVFCWHQDTLEENGGISVNHVTHKSFFFF